MIPHLPFDNSSEGEREIFQSLQDGLDDNFVVFHSVRWINSRNKGQGEADFLILHRYFGILVIEAKGGIIRTHQRLWFQTNRASGVEKQIPDPLAQADSSKFKFLEILDNQNPPIRDCLICSAVWYPSMEWNLPLPPHYAPEILLDLKSLQDPQDKIEAVFKFWNNLYPKPPLSQSSFDKLKFIIAPEYSAVPSVRANFENRERLFITLTRDQARILDFLEEQRTAVISGSAGTGKTLLALEKANRLGVRNEETLFLCFNEALKKHLEENNPITYVHFRTIHELANSFIAVGPNTPLNDITDRLSDFLLGNKKAWKFKNIIIDEAQDFNSLFIEVLQELAKEANGNFYAFYDKNQSIYQEGVMDWANNAECKLTLHTNCRNTKEIARTSARNIGLDSKTFIDSPVKGEQSIIAEYFGAQEGLELVEKIVVNLLKNDMAKPEEIVLLTMNEPSSTFLKGRSYIASYRISRFLAKGKICFNSVDDFKGLEGGYVIIFDVDVKSYVNRQYRNRLYIGCSRAKQRLYILLDSPLEMDYEKAMNAIETKQKIKRNKTAFFHKIAVTEHSE